MTKHIMSIHHFIPESVSHDITNTVFANDYEQLPYLDKYSDLEGKKQSTYFIRPFT